MIPEKFMKLVMFHKEQQKLAEDELYLCKKRVEELERQVHGLKEKLSQNKRTL